MCDAIEMLQAYAEPTRPTGLAAAMRCLFLLLDSWIVFGTKTEPNMAAANNAIYRVEIGHENSHF